MTELKDGLKYFLVFTRFLKCYKTIFVVETEVHLEYSLQQVNSIVCYLSSEQNRHLTLENVELLFRLFGLFRLSFPSFTHYFSVTYCEFNSSQDPSVASLYNLTATFGAGLPRTESTTFTERGFLASGGSCNRERIFMLQEGWQCIIQQ